MSVANSGTLPRPVIVKSIVANAALADATDTDLFLVTIPAMSGYAIQSAGGVVIGANTGAATVLGGAIITTNVDNSAIPAALFLGVLSNIGASVVNPGQTSITLAGFLYNTTSADYTVKFRININVSAGTSSVSATRVFFVPVPVSGYQL